MAPPAPYLCQDFPASRRPARLTTRQRQEAIMAHTDTFADLPCFRA